MDVNAYGYGILASAVATSAVSSVRIIRRGPWGVCPTYDERDKDNVQRMKTRAPRYRRPASSCSIFRVIASILSLFASQSEYAGGSVLGLSTTKSQSP